MANPVGQHIAIMDLLRDRGGLEQLEADLETSGVVTALSAMLTEVCLAACGGDRIAGNNLVRTCVEFLQDYLHDSEEERK